MNEEKIKHLYMFLATYLNHVLKFVDSKIFFESKKINWQFFFWKSHWSCNRILSKFWNGENFHPKKEGSILSNFMQHNGTCIKTSKLSNFNEAWKWLLIAFCFENIFSQIVMILKKNSFSPHLSLGRIALTSVLQHQHGLVRVEIRSKIIMVYG